MKETKKEKILKEIIKKLQLDVELTKHEDMLVDVILGIKKGGK